MRCLSAPPAFFFLAARALLAALFVFATPSLASAAKPVPLSLFFQNGTSAPLTFVDDAPRYLEEIDLSASVTTADDRGVEPLLTDGDFAALDWSGVSLVEEIWQPSLDGTFTRQRFYRHARWMDRPSFFLLFPTDQKGRPLGEPLFAYAGADDRQSPLDDGFVRRFVARQIATGCPAQGNCAGASFTAQGLAQLRYATRASARDEKLSRKTERLRLLWSEDPTRLRDVAVARDDDAPFGPGLRVELEEASEPANGSFYQPGDALQVRLTFRDDEGRRLHPEGSLPTYGQFFRGEVESGLRYLDIVRVSTQLYYAIKHREANLLVALSGPVDRLRTPQTVVDPLEFFAPQVTFARSDVDGYSSVGQVVPAAGIIFGGAADPSCFSPPPPDGPPPTCPWDAPVSDVVTFTVPPDALPGTYLVAAKARREFAGEPRRRGDVLEVRVGSATPTFFTPKTGRCQNCHEGPSSLGIVLHGIGDRRACFGCHSSLGTEFDNALDIRVHTIHDRSDRFPGDVRRCDTCHLVPPAGPARGLLEP
ncbi:MAG: hypothetical protein MUF34_27025 [Polyangiaceae bacterium]|nr:hypothetical protein [Polyangiaceae bacterium]